MTTGFSMAANWLENISGPNPNKDQVAKKDEGKDPILRDLHAMKDAETKEKGGAFPPVPKHDRDNRAPARHLQQQPKPKFVAHKDPVRGKKKGGGKESHSTSDRLGGNHMA
ncbi:hypothetical protein ACHAW5_005613 [Stephanodiscus triporus]|uniref:Uncharacterized protein n=1 Tax=Stephanodiscus triporus TaxID=2934178 RepID=A0ABD3NWF6_9STRA